MSSLCFSWATVCCRASQAPCTPLSSCNKAELSSCNEAELRSCNKAELNCCNKAELSSCNKAELRSCNEAELSSCNKAQAFAHISASSGMACWAHLHMAQEQPYNITSKCDCSQLSILDILSSSLLAKQCRARPLRLCVFVQHLQYMGAGKDSSACDRRQTMQLLSASSLRLTRILRV